MRDAELLRYLVLGAQREGNRLLTDALRPLGVTPSQAEALRVLQDHGPLTLKDLGAHLICETGSPSRLLAALVDAGLVHRDEHPDDGRSVLLHLTPRGSGRAASLRELEAHLYADIDGRVAGLDVPATIALLRTLVAQRPAGRALARREDPATTTTA